jgi:hypothetical protein
MSVDREIQVQQVQYGERNVPKEDVTRADSKCNFSISKGQNEDNYGCK